MDPAIVFLGFGGGAIVAGLAAWWRCPRASPWRPAGVALACLGAGVLAGEAAAAWRDHGLRRELLQRCRLMAAALDRRDLAEHRNRPDDVGQPWFTRTKERLTEARSGDPELVYVYLLEQVGPRILFPNDDDPVTMAGYEPPGTSYDDAPAAMRQAVALGNSFSLGPYTDRWGEFISVGAPVAVAPGRTMHLALDINAARWRRELLLWRAWPAMLGAAAGGIALLLWSRGAALARAREAVKAEEEANRAKDAYLATVSHDLRTPLGGIIGMTGLLADTELTTAQREYVQLAHESGQQLLTLVNELLDYARIEAGELSFDRVHCPLREVVEDAVALIAPIATAKGVELNAVISRDLPASLLGDPDRIRQMLHNLVGNAVKFTDEGEVTVRVSAAPRADGRLAITVAVRDSGIGMDHSMLARLFKPFSQGSEAGRRRGGTGLGLCIAQRIARGMDGDITADSAPRAGSTFTATIVLDPDPSPPELELVKPSHRGAAILVGIEHPSMRESLCELLASLGLRPAIAADPAEAARLAAAAPAPAAAIIDAAWVRPAGPALVAAGVPVATVAARSAGGTTMLASRRTPILLRPFRRDGLMRLLTNLWSERISTGRIVRTATATVRRTAAAPPPAPPPIEAESEYAPSLDVKPPSTERTVARPAAGASADLLAAGLRSGLEAAHEAIAKGDLAGLRRIAHGLRGAAEPLQLHDLAEACRELEAAAAANDHSAVHRIAPRLEQLRLAAQEHLARLRRGSAPG